MTTSVKTLMQCSLVGLSLLASACTGMAMKPYSPPPSNTSRVVPPKATTAPDMNALNKGDPDQRFNAALKMMKDHQPEAQAAFAALARDYPSYSGPLTDLAIIYAQSHQRPQAIAGLTKAITANPRNAVAWNWLGSLYREGNDFIHAEQAYQQALAVKPDYAAVHLNLGILYDTSMRRPQEALSQYREYLRVAGKEDLIVSAWIKDIETTSGITVASGGAP